jgi:hypothetical protein
MAKSRKEENLDNTQERSIATFQSTVDNFSKVAEKLAESFAGFAKTQELDRKAKKKVDGEKKKESGEQKKVRQAMDSANDLFGRKPMQIAGKLMGKANFDGFKKGLAGIKGGGTGGMLSKAASGLGSAGGAILRAAGPIGGVLTGLKMAFDFWDSGGLAKLVAGVKMATGKAGSMLGPGAVSDMQKSLEGTEAMRKIDAKYAYTKPLELQQQLTQDVFNLKKSFAQDTLAFEQSLVKEEVDYEIGLRKDALQFQLDQQKEVLDAELEKRKAISASGISFIQKYATISERALKAISSGTKQVLEGVGKFTATFGLGIKQSFQLSENAQGLAYHLSGSDEDVMNMTKLFQTMGNTSAEMAQNLIAGFTEFAKINDIAPQVIFNQIKEAGEDIYKFSNGTADSFAKQAVLLSKMSVSMSSMMKASDTMVLNYKDSIKAEMSLSSMLGKNVNLSEVRAKLMAGDQAGGAAALKSALGGMDIGAMNPFAKQQLTQATGMDISALMALMEGKEDPKVAGELKAEAAKGKAFADAALAQDIANQGAKLKLEQEQRKKLLEFEQKQRLSMMIMENAQKMEMIQLESQQRAYWEVYYAKDMEEKMLAGQTLEEVGSGFLASSNAKMAAGGLNQAFEAYGLDPNMGAVNATRDAIVKLQEEKLINGAELKEFTTSLFDGLEGVNLKDPKAVEAAFAKAGEGVFGEKVAARNAKANEKIERIIKIAEDAAGSATGTGTTKFQTEIGATKDEIEAALKLVKETSSTLTAGSFGYTETKTYGLDAKKIEALKQANTLGFKSLTTSTDANTAQTLVLSTEVATNGQSQVALQTENNTSAVEANMKADYLLKQGLEESVTQATLDKELAGKQYDETQFGTALQIETVSLLGLQTQILLKIAENTEGAFDSAIQLNGNKLAESLLAQSRRDYALGGAGRPTLATLRGI